jgi:hypothetical protein
MGAPRRLGAGRAAARVGLRSFVNEPEVWLVSKMVLLLVRLGVLQGRGLWRRWRWWWYVMRLRLLLRRQ